MYRIYLDSSRQVSIDSRNVAEGSVFFALKGENSNGNLYAADALKKGASAVVVDDPTLQDLPRHFYVQDALTALQELATHHRSQLQIPVIGVTGSNGKTTTKKLIHAVLSSFFRTYCTQGNYNNHIGVPLTILSIPEQTEFAVIEMGANHQGEIQQLCQIAQPTHGIITNIGKAHLEGFGGIEGVKKGKGELFVFLGGHQGIAFVNIQQPFLKEISERVSNNVVAYSTQEYLLPEVQFGKIKLESLQPRIQFHIDEFPFDCDLFGEHNFSNIISAIVIGHHFGVPFEKMSNALHQFTPESNRSQIVSIGSNQFLMDAYNANPSSMRASVESFFSMQTDLPKLLILGDMLELGEYSEKEHNDMAHWISGLTSVQSILVGKNFQNPAKTLGITHFLNVNELKEWWKKSLITDHFILLKGSRGIALEKMLAD